MEQKMPVIPIDIYEVFEEKFGKEGARKIVKGFEAIISDATDYKWKTTKDELLEAIRKEFVSKEAFDEKINWLKTHLEEKIENTKIDLEGKIENIRVDLEGKIENIRVNLENTKNELNQKFNFMIIILIIALTLMNPAVAELIKNLIR